MGFLSIISEVTHFYLLHKKINILQNSWPVLLKAAKVMGKRKLLETVTNQKTIEIRRINAKCAEYPGLDPGTEKGHHWKSW